MHASGYHATLPSLSIFMLLFFSICCCDDLVDVATDSFEESLSAHGRLALF